MKNRNFAALAAVASLATFGLCLLNGENPNNWLRSLLGEGPLLATIFLQLSWGASVLAKIPKQDDGKMWGIIGLLFGFFSLTALFSEKSLGAVAILAALGVFLYISLWFFWPKQEEESSEE